MKRGFLLFVLVSMGLSLPAHAQNWADDESVVSKSLKMYQRGKGQVLKLRKALKLNKQYNGAVVKSLIILAKTKKGKGKMQLLINKQPVTKDTVAQGLQVYEIPVDKMLGSEIRSLQLKTNGNFYIESVTAVLEDEFGSPPPPPPAMLQASGHIESWGFDFAGPTGNSIKNQCMDMLLGLQANHSRLYIDDIQVNGHVLRNGPSYWNASETCQLVSSHAE